MENQENKRKMRTLRVRMLDGSVKTVLVDDSQNVANLMVVICTKIGITNHDEYSLVRDLPEDNKKNTSYSSGTLTLGRSKKDRDKTIDSKMEQLKKKLKTDDDLNWVDHSQTLSEQGIAEDETLLLRRKFFFSDQNVDQRDPIELNLLYVQTRDAIIAGTHPVTVEEACQFAGLQCQIQFGDHVEGKHRPGFLDLKEFLPKDYAKTKGIEKKVFQQHMKHAGLTELEAKNKYIQLARSLKTYGVTFFLVKEKMNRKNKLVPRLLGVTKDSVLRLDEKTKEILKTWPLTTVKRWAASPNSFTLDFGDYADSYYSVQTSEGEQISQLIAGYIDIILKRKKAKDHFGIEGDEGSTMVEDSVSPYKATVLQYSTLQRGAQPEMSNIALPAVLRAGTNGPQSIVTNQMPPVQLTSVKGTAHVGHSPADAGPKHPHVHSTGLPGPQRALITTTETCRITIQRVERDLSTPADTPDLGNDQGSMQWKRSQIDVKRSTVLSQLSAMNAATAKIVTLTSVPEEEMDTPALGAALSTISSNLPEMSRDVKLIASLIGDDSSGDSLIGAAKSLCSAFSDLLRAAEPGAKIPRPVLLSAASRVGEASHSVLTTINIDNDYDKETSNILLSIAKQVAKTTATLVLKAEAIASSSSEQEVCGKVISSATQCALATSQLVICSKVVAPTINNPSCQRQLTESCRDVSRAVDNVVKTCQDSTGDDKLIRDLKEAATGVTRALNDLLNHIRSIGDGRTVRFSEPHDGTVDTILDATDRLFSSTGDAGEMVRQAKVLAQATTQLIVDIKSRAGSQSDSDVQKRLLAAAKVLADATSRLMEAAKGCATNPHDSESQAALRKAAEDLRNATNTAASNALRKKVISRLEISAQYATSSATQNIAAIHGSSAYIENRMVREELEILCNEVSESMTSVVQGIRGVQLYPDETEKQVHLINACDAFIGSASKMVDASKAAIPNITDQSCSIQMKNAVQEMNESLSELKIRVIKAQEACTSTFDIEDVVESIRSLINEVDEYKRSQIRGTLKPLPGDSVEKCISQLNSDCKMVGSIMAQLLTAASHGNEVHAGAAARDTTDALRDLVRSIRGVAACSEDHEYQMRVLNNTKEVLERSINLFEETKWAMENCTDRDTSARLANVAKTVSTALNSCVNCMPGQRDVDEAVRTITESTQSFSSITITSTNGTNGVRSYNDVQSKLASAASRLNDAASDVVSNSRSPNSLSSSAKRFSTAFSGVANCSIEAASSIKDVNTKEQMISSMKNLSSASNKLLISAKSVASDPHSPHAKANLTAAARALSEAISNLLNVTTATAPGQKEVESAIRNIQMMKPMLDNPIEPINNSSYFDCLDSVMEISRRLGDAMTSIGHNAERGDHDAFGESVREASSSVCGLIENAAQSAYLVGAADPSSVAGRPGLVDLNAFHKANDAIQTACQQLINRNSNQQTILSAATVIAKHTSALCNSCRAASSKTTNPIAKRHFVQAAKDVANATAILVKEIKTLDQNPDSERNRQACAEATKPLIEAVDNLVGFASSSDFAAIPARISDKARIAQTPITNSGRLIIENFCSMLTTAKSLAINSKDPHKWQSLASHSKNVSDSIKNLVSSIKDASPGQKECDKAIDKLRKNIKDLDKASMDLANHTLTTRRDHNLKTYREIMSSTLNEISDKLDPVRITGKCEAENIGHTVTNLSSYFDPLVHNAISCAAKAGSTKLQLNFLDQTKTVCECGLQLLCTVKECGGNPKAVSVHSDIDDACEALKEALQDLTHTLQASSTGDSQVSGIIETITKSLTRIEDRYSFASAEVTSRTGNFVEYQTRMVSNLREIIRIAQEIASKSITEPESLGPLINQLGTNYANLATDTAGAVVATKNVDLSQRIKSSVHELGQACVHLTRGTGLVQNDPNDAMAQRDVAEQGKIVSEKASYVLAALQSGSRGTQACINAASTVSGIIGDIDTTIMFATAGTLNPENEADVFSSHRESILRSAKALVEDTKSLVLGAASNQEQLADAAQNAVTTIVHLSDTVKLGAASLGASNSEAQVLLLNAVKDVATALGELIHATKAASGKNNEDPAMIQLKESAKVMITNVTSLLKTVKIVEDEHQRGTRALEATIQAIGQELRVLDSSDPPSKKGSPEDLLRVHKPVTLATAKAVAAGNSGKQDDVIVAANMGRKAIFDLLVTTKQCAHGAESHDLTRRVLDTGRNCALKYRTLLQLVHQCIQRPSGATSDEKQQLIENSRNIASSVTEIVACVEALKGTDWVDPDDPTVIAETELLGAASSIDAAAKKLASLQPRRTSIKLPHEDMNFDEMILEAAKSITAATSALVRAASAAQRELVTTGKVSSRPVSTSDDGQWSEGLISAARHVAAATHSLVEAANALVQGHASEERLISSAKQVASSTAQLLVACKVKADPDSKSMVRLQGAGNAVKKATDNLVKAAQQAIEHDEEQSIVISQRRVPVIAQEILAREEILRKEKELKDAQERLTAIRKAKYTLRKHEEYHEYHHSETSYNNSSS